MRALNQPITLDFGVLGIPAAVVDGGDGILYRIVDELSSAGYDLDVIGLIFGGNGRINVVDGDDTALGTITISQPEQPEHAEGGAR
ncbi:hypothetical protein [Salinispora mooreana]|uniref:hypothetical protein n=1 Tax=Salinispora mooreana TaxID=999545 RepID=UPI00036D3C3E|nr:hypothetical protein [Salinispora mooreana]